ncbi:MAG: RNA polymerase sigma factor [Bacteroidetes bacterium]|nr:RNA polymerase sigma factor [Bacteroidota bacterium]
MTDPELIGQYKATDDLKYLGSLFERYVELVYGLCLKYLKNEMLAEDAVMGIFEKLVIKVREHEITNFKSWLHVLSRNYCLEQLRKENKNLTVSYDPAFMQSVDSRHHIMEIEENGAEKVLLTCLEDLPDQQKKCIHLFYYEGKSYKEIGVLLEKKIGNIRSYIQNGRRNLKNCMEKKNEAITRK